MSESLVLQLATRQLTAYNAADLDAFCACYHSDVKVLDVDGAVTVQGMEAFRSRYAGLFRDFEDVHAEVDARVVLGPHVVEHEAWSRRNRATGEVSGGTVLVRYTEREGAIAVAQFLHG